MSILVFGGTGFIGKKTVELLMAQHHPVTVFTRTPPKDISSAHPNYVLGDLLDIDSINDLSPFQTFINCAGAITDEQIMYQLHVESLLNMLNKIKDIPNCHWIQLSSVGVYGKPHQGIIKEDTTFAPIGEYEVTKAKADEIVQTFCKEHHINYTIIRPSTVFGIGMPNQSIIQLIKSITRHLFFYIGNNASQVQMNYIPVEDVAQLILNCIDNPKALNQDFVISDDISLSDFVRIISEELGSKTHFPKLNENCLRVIAKIMRPFSFYPLKESRINALTTRARYSMDKAKNRMDFDNQIGTEQGLRLLCKTLQ